MASSNVILGFWKSNGFQKFNVENVDLNDKVEVLKSRLNNSIGDSYLEKLGTLLELSYAGVILEDNKILSSYGITSGVTIHVVEKKIIKPHVTEKVITESEVQELVSNVRNFKMSPAFRSTLHRLQNPEEIDKVVAAVPGLEDDPVAIVMISQADLILQMEDPKIVRKLAEKHPKLIEATKFIGTEFHKSTTLNPSGVSTQPSTSTGYSYSLDALSDDDEDMDSDATGVSQHPLTRNSSYNAITAAQLAAAIANATNTGFDTNSAGIPTTPSSSFITNEMFSSAMQQAFAIGGSSGNSTAPNAFSPTSAVSPAGGEETLETITRRLQPQLQQMREMGLVNDSVNVRALQATGGDVQAAIDLVFNGVID